MEGRGAEAGREATEAAGREGRGEGGGETPAAHRSRASPLDRLQSHFSGSITRDPSESPEDTQGRSCPVS